MTFSSGSVTVLNVRAERACTMASMRLPAASISALQDASICAGVSDQSIFSGTVRGAVADDAANGSSASDAAAAMERREWVGVDIAGASLGSVRANPIAYPRSRRPRESPDRGRTL